VVGYRCHCLLPEGWGTYLDGVAGARAHRGDDRTRAVQHRDAGGAAAGEGWGCQQLRRGSCSLCITGQQPLLTCQRALRRGLRYYFLLEDVLCRTWSTRPIDRGARTQHCTACPARPPGPAPSLPTWPRSIKQLQPKVMLQRREGGNGLKRPALANTFCNVNLPTYGRRTAPARARVVRCNEYSSMCWLQRARGARWKEGVMGTGLRHGCL
jgi:hypothetical protein